MTGRSHANCLRLAPEGVVSMLAGGGNNGAGGLCAARHLLNMGRQVEVIVASTRLGAAAERHLKTLEKMDVPFADELSGGVVVDALVGYGLRGALRSRSAELAAAASGRTTVSLDFPSGHGHAGAVVCDACLTLALPKRGLEDVEALYLADIGLPEVLWTRMGIASGTPFKTARVVRLWA